ncbi:hypothetical protein P3T73_11100 [Kiritimatiellota bacterium B12222]|nr:hypothetical protein P3T73_11100 [Kiritimatiellota bacterium B12222]
MNKQKLLFALITLIAFVLTFWSGFYLKLHASELSKPAILGWGAIFVASALTVVRGIRYMGQK